VGSVPKVPAVEETAIERLDRLTEESRERMANTEKEAPAVGSVPKVPAVEETAIERLDRLTEESRERMANTEKDAPWGPDDDDEQHRKAISEPERDDPDWDM